MFGKLLIASVIIAMVGFFTLSYEGRVQTTARVGEQNQLLGQLEAVHTPASSQLVDDLRNAFPSPSSDDIARLRLLVQRVQANPASAAKYTLAAKQAALKKADYCGKIASVVTGRDLCDASELKPGLD